MNLDKLDFKLLYELEQDSRKPLSLIAKKLHTSEQVISYRIKSLQERGIISNFFTIIDIAKLGYTSYRTMVKLKNINKKDYEELISYLKKHNNILWLVECGGRWDLIINITAKNIIHYNSIINEIKEKFSNQIHDYDVLTTLEVIGFGRDYFIDRRREIKKSPYFGREFKLEQLDNLDLKILKLISENARLNSVEIASKLDITPNTVIARIKQLIKKDIIQAFKPLIHLDKINYSAYKSLIKLQNLSKIKEEFLINYLREKNNVVGVIKLVGLWDFEIEFEVSDKEKMLALTRDIREKFKDIIKEFETIPLFHEYRYNYFPGDLLYG